MFLPNHRWFAKDFTLHEINPFQTWSWRRGRLAQVSGKHIETHVRDRPERNDQCKRLTS